MLLCCSQVFLGLWFVEIYLLIHPYQTHLTTWPSFVHNHLNGQVFAHLILRITWQKLLIWMISKDILIQIQHKFQQDVEPASQLGRGLQALVGPPECLPKTHYFFQGFARKTYRAELWFLDYFAIFCLFVWLKKVFVEPSGCVCIHIISYQFHCAELIDAAVSRVPLPSLPSSI